MRNKMFPLVVAVCLIAALLCGCGSGEEPLDTTQPSETVMPTETVEETEPTEAPTEPEPTAPPIVDIGGTELDVATTIRLDLTNTQFVMEDLLAAAPWLTHVVEIELGTTELSTADVLALFDAFPGADFHYSVNLFGRILTPDVQELDLSRMRRIQAPELIEKLPLLTGLKKINFVNSVDVCVFGLNDIDTLDQIRAAAPNVELRLSFDLFGRTVLSTETYIRYFCRYIGDEGLPTLRAVLPYLTSCNYLLLDGCGISDDNLAQLREDFPERNVVWRVWTLKNPIYSKESMRTGSFLTDTKLIHTMYISDETCMRLKYCNQVKYLDVGHAESLSDFSFLSYMPNLEAAIIGLTKCADITPLLDCPELEYLELFTCDVTDLSVLSACTKLKHLNISNLNVDDMTCLYELDLERLRAVRTNIPQEQFDEYARLHPNCKMLMQGENPTSNGWRYDDDGTIDPRYKLLRQQMEYDEDLKYLNP